MRFLLSVAFAVFMAGAQAFGGSPRKGISYKPTPTGGRACYIDGAFAYEMPQVPTGYIGSSFGVEATPALQDGPRAESDWKPYLEAKGIRFPKGASATYFGAFGHLVVVNTREQHERLLKMVTPE